MLQTFDQNDMNTQAIRELTTEVSNLKQKHKKDVESIQTSINEVASKEVKFIDVPLSLVSGSTVSAGAVVYAQKAIPTIEALNNKTVIGYDMLYALTDGGYVSTSIIKLNAYVISATNTLRVYIYNYTAEDVVINSVLMRIFYKG